MSVTAAAAATPLEPSRWVNLKKLLGRPLIDPGVRDEDLAAWLDANTMLVPGSPGVPLESCGGA